MTTGDGSDDLDGDGGNDILNAGAGDDGLLGGDSGSGTAAANTLNGGDGADTVVFEGSNGDDNVNAASADGVLTAAAVADTHTSIQNFIVNGLGGNDTITTGSGNDTVNGDAGNDTLRTGGGGDRIGILGGSDNIDGQAGSDQYSVLFGGLGTVTIADTGPAAPGDEDTLMVSACSGVTVTDTQAVRGGEVVNYSGIEKRPCGFVPPPPRRHRRNRSRSRCRHRLHRRHHPRLGVWSRT
jgi:Ca2+-binding RTX toxin-like protein